MSPDKKVNLSPDLVELMNSQNDDYWFEYVVKADPNEIKKNITEDYIISRDLHLHLDIYEQKGDTPTIIFIHGTSVYSRFYAEFIYNLWKQGFRVVAPDLQGHGRSEGKRGDFTMQQFEENIYDIVTYILDNYKTKIGVMGSSLGGISSLYATANDHRINSCICHNAAVFNEKAHEKIVKPKGWIKVFKFLIPVVAKLVPKMKFSVWLYLDVDRLISTPEYEDKKDVLLNDKILSDKYTLRAIRTQMVAPLKTPLEEIKTPIMIINGTYDYLFTVEYMTELYERITSKKRLEIIPDASHLIFQENLEESLKRVVAWFKETLK